jgi:hypothetical protein
MSNQELVRTFTASTGEARFRYARENFDALLKSFPKPAHFLWDLVDHETFEVCFDQPAYSAFVIEATERLIELYRTDLRSLGLSIEHCMNSIGKSKRETEEFVDFCNSFGNAIEPFVLGVDDNFCYVILPLQDSRNKKNPGIRALGQIVAKTLVLSVCPGTS